MRNFWLMARHEYTRLALRRSFVLSLVGFPLLIACLIGVGIWTASRNDGDALGYVDESGLLQTASPWADLETPLRAFPDEASARQALNADEIHAFYLLPADYLQGHTARLIYKDEAPGRQAQRDFERVLRAALAADLPADTQARVLAGADLSVRAADGSRTMADRNPLDFIIPFATAMLFIFAAMTSSGYLLQVVTDEKENRTMEMLLTSLRPFDLIGGKAVGLMALALSQLAIWMGAIAVGIGVGSRFWDALQGAAVPWTILGITGLFFLPSYVLLAGLMTAIGSAVTDARQGQQVAGVLNLLFVAPFFVLPVIIEAPNSPIALGFTFFPTTSLITVVMRWAFGSVPLWQLLVSLGIVWLTALLSIWLAVRVFRIGMLEYGQPLSPRRVLAALDVRR